MGALGDNYMIEYEWWWATCTLMGKREDLY